MELVSHIFARNTPLGLPAGALEYVVGSDGLYLRAERPGIRVVGHLARAEVRGLAGVAPEFALTLPRVPSLLLFSFLLQSAQARDAKGRIIEALGYLRYGADGWELHYPEVEATATSVRPVSDAPDGYGDALVEIHSHHTMPARFSQTDDRDEVGFRVYAVVGGFGSPRPELTVRVGVYGYFFPLPARAIFEHADELMMEFAGIARALVAR